MKRFIPLLIIILICQKPHYAAVIVRAPVIDGTGSAGQL